MSHLLDWSDLQKAGVSFGEEDLREKTGSTVLSVPSHVSEKRPLCCQVFLHFGLPVQLCSVLSQNNQVLANVIIDRVECGRQRTKPSRLAIVSQLPHHPFQPDYPPFGLHPLPESESEAVASDL